MVLLSFSDSDSYMINSYTSAAVNYKSYHSQSDRLSSQLVLEEQKLFC